jgi:hypothetical protein
LRIAMMTIKLLLRGRVSSQEILADTEQLRSRNVGLERTNATPTRLAIEGGYALSEPEHRPGWHKVWRNVIAPGSVSMIPPAHDGELRS